MHEVALSERATEVLQRLELGERFDVILCDLLMPEMTGIDLFRELEKRFPDQAERMVFMTGGATTETARIFIDGQRDRVLSKPFRPEEIEAAVLAITDRSSSSPRVRSASS
jgi:CheY-like chemotaxis protein